MDRIRNKYNPEVSAAKAQDVLTGISKTEYEGWLQHPCTKSLKYTMEADLDMLVLNWVQGVYTDVSIESTAIKQSNVTGQTSAIEAILSYIDQMLNEENSAESAYEEAIYKP